MSPALRPPDQTLFFRESLADDPRLGSLAKAWSSHARPPGWVIAGHPDDEGIQLNGGRPGAKDGPSTIRRFLYRLTPDWLQSEDPLIFDAGDFEIQNLTLAQRHEQALVWLESRHREGFQILTLGGGHDYGYPDMAAFAKAHQHSKVAPLIVHLDAHFDVRPTENGFHSGTPIRRLFDSNLSFDLIAIGMQTNCNARAHAAWLSERATKIVSLDEILLSGESEETLMLRHLAPLLERHRPVFVSLDIDIIRNSEAPGCSQSWPLGLSAKSVAIVLEVLSQRSRLSGAGIYEVSPALDVDNRTSRLAAQLAHRLLSRPRPEAGD